MPRTGKHKIQTRRVYEEISPDEGACFLVDRVWPRGIKKSALSAVTWLREAAPSAALRKWFGHEPAKWPEFQARYRAELRENPAACDPLLNAVKKEDVVLLFAAKNEAMNNAVVLKKFLEEQGR